MVRAGGVVVLPASKRELSLREKVITQSSRGIPGSLERDDQFGAALTSADFDRDGFADLAVGAPSHWDGSVVSSPEARVASARGRSPR